MTAERVSQAFSKLSKVLLITRRSKIITLKIAKKRIVKANTVQPLAFAKIEVFNFKTLQD